MFKPSLASTFSGVLYLVAIFLGLAFCVYLLRPPSKIHPPGPSPLPFIGNLLQLSSAPRLEVLFNEWGGQYGDVIYATTFGKPTIILNTFQAAQDLLDKKGSIYSDRPRFVLFSELMGWQDASTHVRYGNRFRKHRRFMHQTFNQRAAGQLKPIQEKQALIFIHGLIKTPDILPELTKRFASATILKVTYGANITSVDDPFVLLAEEAGNLTVTSGSAAATLVDYFPLMKFIPLWAPFSGFKRQALKAKAAVEKMMDIPFEIVKNDMKTGNAPPSMTLSLLESCIKTRGQLMIEDERDIKGVAGSVSSAASETTVSVIECFVLLMVLYPEIQKKAQEEIDRVIGGDRLPTFDDRDNLPYLECVLKETYRWSSPVPLGMPHRLMEDDIYRGYFMPKGSTVVANIYAMLQNCSEPDLFKPERFVNESDMPDPKELVFGFGRRKCPGRYFADSGVWLVAASMLAVFQIEKAKDDNGIVIEPTVEFSRGLTRRPLDIKCAIAPRCSKLIESIRQTVEMTSP